MYSHQYQGDLLQPPPLPPAPPTVMHQLVDNVSGPLYHQQPVTIYPPAPTTTTYSSPLPSLPTMNGMAKTTSSDRNDGYAHHVSQPQLPAEPVPSTTNTPTTPMTFPQLAQFAATVTYFLWYVRTSSVMALHSASSQVDLASATANLSVNNQGSTATTSPLQQQQINPAFQRFCQQILTATQVSESVVLLALKYIAKLLQTNPTIQGAQGSEYRLFIVALLLANKFHDDNTFTNKTWADISGMKLYELDIMELEFLNVLDFRLFIGKEEFDHWKTGLFTFMLQVQNATAMQEQQHQQMMDATLQSMGLCLPPPSPQDVPVAHQHPYPSYLFSTTAQPDLLQIQPLNTPVTRVPLRIPSYPVYMPIQSNSASSSIHSTPTSVAGASHVPTSYVSSSTPIKGALYPPPQMYHQPQQQQQHLPPLSNSNPAAYASSSQLQQSQQQQQQQPYIYPTSSSRPLPRNASTPSLSAWAHQSTRSTTPMDQTQQQQQQQQHHHHHPHPHHHHHHQRAYRPYQRPVTTNNSLDHQQPLVDYYAWKSLTQGNHGQLDRTPSPMKTNHRPSSSSSHRRRSYSNPFPQQHQQMLKPYAFPRQQGAPHDSNHYQDYQQIGADPSRLQHDQQQQQQQYHLNGAHHSN